MDRDFTRILNYWGKALPDKASSAVHWHPLILHCLDVAAVADALMTARPQWLERVAATLCLRPDDARRLLLWLVVLHDFGKFAGNFQVRVAALQPLLNLSAGRYGCTARHDAVGIAMVETVQEKLHAETLARAAGLPGEGALQLLLSATTGHHGRPRSAEAVRPFTESWDWRQQDDAFAFALYMWRFFDAEKITGLAAMPPDADDLKAISWDVAGLTVLADWLGSNTDWFPYAAPGVLAGERSAPTELAGLQGYWADAQQRGAKALAEAGLLVAAPAPFETGKVVPCEYALRPAQQLAADLPLPPDGSLWILEDQTGSGKTEAALLWLHRQLAAAQVDGVFIALPTQATANALYARASAILPRLVLDPSQASGVLSHSSRDYNGLFRAALRSPAQQERLLAGEAEPATLGYSAWLAESNKRALLAQFGVGTIDQTLLCELRSKHQALRMFGLERKLLLIDEVHAYDAYQARLLRGLLTRAAARGCPVVLLSATLPMAQRQQFVNAYARGLKRSTGRPVKLPEVQSTAYPLLTCLDAGGLQERPVATQQRPHRYRIRYLSSIDAVTSTVLAAAQAGKAVAWVRNTVAEARSAYDRLRAVLPAELQEKIQLFHSRYALGDRISIEQQVQKNFDKASGPPERAGRILIATQVIEQSLDLDFDVMVSDLAPIDLLIQRAGRLFRHSRDRHGNLQADGGADERGEPELLVFGPDREASVEASWVSQWSRCTAMVYPHHAQLYCTARVLGDCLDLSDARAPIEAVYAAAEGDYPASLQRAAYKAEGNKIGDEQVAVHNTIAEDEGYEAKGHAWPDDLTAPTRLGEPSIELVLARIDAGRIVPWIDAGEDSWAMSVTRCRRDQLDRRAPLGVWEAAAQQLENNESVLRWRTLLLLDEDDGGWAGSLVEKKGGVVRLAYDAERGLSALPKRLEGAA